MNIETAVQLSLAAFFQQRVCRQQVARAQPLLNFALLLFGLFHRG